MNYEFCMARFIIHDRSHLRSFFEISKLKSIKDKETRIIFSLAFRNQGSVPPRGITQNDFSSLLLYY